MTTDLWMLVGAAALQWALIMVAANPGLMADIGWAFGNREKELALPAWAGRAKRASANLQENLPIFTILVLVVHVAGAANPTSALGAQIFLGARVLHGALYIAGIAYARTAAWATSLVGMAMVASALA
jgi:uncharacterized MAPEG superfamily protein